MKDTNMKFFESKYYTPLDVQDDSYMSFNSNQRLRDATLLKTEKDSFAADVLSRYCIHLPRLINFKINTAKIISDWILVTDLTCYTRMNVIAYDEDTNQSLVEYVYFNKELECFARIPGMRTVDKTKQLSISFIRIPIFGNVENVVERLMELEYIIPHVRHVTPEIGILTQSESGFHIRNTPLAPVDIDFDTMYSGDFRQTSDKILEFTNDMDSKGLIILHGTPGSGKTNYIRWLTGNSKRSMIYIPPDLVASLTKPTFLDFLLRNKGHTFIVEDGESTLVPRVGKDNSIVSSILNLTDGILGDALNCQFICTFNTEIENIDSALLRPGRLLVRHEFGMLSVDEANAYLKSVDKARVVSEPISLAELMNIDNGPISSAIPEKPAFGFAAQM